MIREEFEALIARDRTDIVDILTTSAMQVSDADKLLFAVMQMKLLGGLVYWVCDVLAAKLGDWDTEAFEPEEGEKYDA